MYLDRRFNHRAQSRTKRKIWDRGLHGIIWVIYLDVKRVWDSTITPMNRDKHRGVPGSTRGRVPRIAAGLLAQDPR